MLKKHGNAAVALLCPKNVRFGRPKACPEFATNSLDINAKGRGCPLTLGFKGFLKPLASQNQENLA